MNMIITTAGRPDEQSAALQNEAARQLNAPAVERNKRSIQKLQDTYQCDVLVAGKDRYSFYKRGAREALFFHPNSATYRLKRLQKGQQDPLVEAAQLRKGDRFLDCTLGFASDAIIASSVAGSEGQVEGLEADPAVAFLTANGLKQFPIDFPALQQAMERITVIQQEAVSFLKGCPADSRDIVYLDPMFTKPIEESSNFEALRTAGACYQLTDEWVEEALRVCRRRVVLKDHFESPLFEKFSFDREIRLHTKVHYGVLRKGL